MAVIQDKVRGLMVPLAGRTLLVPNVAIAEVMPFIEPQTAGDDAPDWLLGHIDWRGHRLPLISVEAVQGDPCPAIDRETRVAVINTIKGEGGVPFYAIITRGIPHLVRLGEEDVESTGALEPARGELARVVVDRERATIPDLDTLESLVAKVA